MANKRALWTLHSLAAAYGRRPSEFLGITEETWLAYQLDLACLTLGRWIENRLAERDKKGRPVHCLEDLLKDAEESPDGPGQFSNPAALVKRKVKIKPGGTW